MEMADLLRESSVLQEGTFQTLSLNPYALAEHGWVRVHNS